MKTPVLALLLALTSLLLPVVGAAPASAATCADPRFVTSDENGMWSQGPYVVHNNMWNTGGYDVSETLEACAHGNWSVTATADDRAGDGAVKTYPNVHRDYHDWSTGEEPALGSFSKIKSRFAARTPRVGVYDTAFDLWLNGVADRGSTEVMIWTDNHRQVPAGSVVARHLRFSGHAWRLYATGDDSYLAFVPRHRITRDTFNLKKMLRYLVREDRLPAGSTLGQICYGFEIVSTGGSDATFKVDKFKVRSPRR